MRIYEIAREAGVTSVEVLKAAEAAGMEATSAISSVDADEAAALKAAVSKDAGGGRLAKRAEKRNLAAELNYLSLAESSVLSSQFHTSKKVSKDYKQTTPTTNMSITKSTL